MIPTVMSWSGGKDSCMALHVLRRGGAHDVRALLTTVILEDGCVAMHGVDRTLLARQAAALGMPIDFVPVPAGASNAVYEAALGTALARHRSAGVEAIAFGDLFLADIRRYREALVAPLGLTPVFPVWGCDTHAFVDRFVSAGFRAIVASVDPALLDATFAGRTLDADFVADLPDGVDPCGENGEFHTFVIDGPNFAAPIDVRIGQTVHHGGMTYSELR